MRKVTGVKFFNDTGAVDLHSTDTDAEFMGDHFVGLSCNRLQKDVAFPHGKPRNARFQRCRRESLVTELDTYLQRTLYAADDRVVIEGLFDEVNSASPHCGDSHWHIGMACDYDNRV
jgi:hypothetical protein